MNHVCIIDLGLSNISCVVSAVKRVASNAIVEIITSPASLINRPSHILLPGMGSFSEGIDRIRASKWDKYLFEVCIQKQTTSLLGICLGMQLLATTGSEGCIQDYTKDGLDFIRGKIKPLTNNQNDKHIAIPHIGWNSVSINSQTTDLFFDIPDLADFYFLHSYIFSTEDSDNNLGITNHGLNFTSAINHKRVYGVQFHPEKSQRLGEKLLFNFLKRC
jgi:glutamine amidotransferase